MAERQSKLRSDSGMGHAKQPKGSGDMTRGSMHAPRVMINHKSHPNDSKTGHIKHYKENSGSRGGDTFSHRRSWMGD